MIRLFLKVVCGNDISKISGAKDRQNSYFNVPLHWNQMINVECNETYSLLSLL